MSKEHILYVSFMYSTFEDANAFAKAWSKGVTRSFYSIPSTPLAIGKEYNTVLKAKNGQYYVTNRFDPRVVQWCKENNVVPKDM